MRGGGPLLSTPYGVGTYVFPACAGVVRSLIPTIPLASPCSPQARGCFVLGKGLPDCIGRIPRMRGGGSLTP